MKQENIELPLIDPNPNNPRGINISTQDKKLGLLKESIEQFGILVPLVVTKVGARYELLDGERRYVAAKALGIKTVPAYVTTEKLTENDILLRMFHIHHNREQWGPIQQCFALENLYKRLCSRKAIRDILDDRTRIKAIAEEVVSLTGIEFPTAESRIWFLRWPDEIKKRLYTNPTDDYWYICEIENRIIIPALKNYPEYFKKVPVDEVRSDLFKKLESHSVTDATEVRVAAPIANIVMEKNNDRAKVLHLLDDLRTDTAMTYTEALQEYRIAFPDALRENPPSLRKLLSLTKNLFEAVKAFEINLIDTKKGKIIDVMSELARTVTDLIKALTLLKDKLHKK